MKKQLVILLSLMLAAAVLASCLVIPGENSSTETQPEASAASGTESEADPGSGASEAEQSQTEVLIEYETVVSVGKSYEMTKEPDDKYPDPGHAKLTDGLYSDSASYTDEHYAGFQASNSSVRITLDMGEDYKQI